MRGENGYACVKELNLGWARASILLAILSDTFHVHGPKKNDNAIPLASIDGGCQALQFDRSLALRTACLGLRIPIRLLFTTCR